MHTFCTNYRVRCFRRSDSVFASANEPWRTPATTHPTAPVPLSQTLFYQVCRRILEQQETKQFEQKPKLKTGGATWRHFSADWVRCPTVSHWNQIHVHSHTIYERKENTHSTRGEKNQDHHKFMIHSNTNHIQHFPACFHQRSVQSGCSLSNNITSTCSWAEQLPVVFPVAVLVSNRS